MQVESGLMAYVELINARLAELLPPENTRPTELHAAMRYSCLAPGKRLRPALTMTVARACGGRAESALDAACAIEMVHAFSLIHDDLPALDNDELRRGRPTCHKVYGEAVAILAGDALYGLAFSTIAHSTAGLDGVREIARATGAEGLVAGEALDILSEGKPATAEIVEAIHRQKTGALFAACGTIGALCANQHGLVEPMRQYGMSLGLAFQIADDVLNETSNAETLGKAAGSDRDLLKQTYPAVYGLETSKQLAQEAVNHAISALMNLPGDTQDLRELANYAIQRTK